MVLVDRGAFQNVLVGQGVPRGPVVENPSCNAGDMGSIPGLGRSHVLRDNRTQAPQLLRPSAATTEPVPHNARNHRNEEPVRCNRRVAPACRD